MSRQFPAIRGSLIGLVTVALAATACGSSSKSAAAGKAADTSAAVTSAATTTAPAAATKTTVKATGGGDFCKNIAKAVNNPISPTGGTSLKDEKDLIAASLAQGELALGKAPKEIKPDAVIVLSAIDNLFKALEKANYDYTKIDPAALSAVSSPAVTTAETPPRDVRVDHLRLQSQHQLTQGAYPRRMGTGHVHDVAAGRSRSLTIALSLNLVIVVGQVIAGLRAHSLGLLADAGHNLVDVAAILLALTALRWSRRAPTTAKSYGYHRATILAALANAVLIVAVTGWLAVEGIRRLDHPPVVRGGLVAMVALGAALLNVVAVLVVRERGRNDLNLRAVMLHLGGDVVASLAVAAAGLAIWLGGPDRLDPVASLVVAVLIGIQAVRLVRDSIDVLLESTPTGLDIDAMVATLCTDPGVLSVHDLHVWSLSSDVRAMSAHVLVSGHPTLEEARMVGDRLKAQLAADFAIGHATLELECETCDDEPPPCFVEPSPAQRRAAAHH